MWSRRPRRSPIAERPDRALVRLYWPAARRPAFDALFAIDEAMAEVVAHTTEPALGAIRLAWWRERLEGLDAGQPPAEPRLEAVARELLSRGISGADLAALEGGWRRLFDPFPWTVSTAEAVWFRGRHMFTLAARLLGGGGGEAVEAAGGAWALADVARHCSDAASRLLLLDQARNLSDGLVSHRFDKALRPLTMMAALARRDVARGEPFEPEGTPGRAAALLAHRLTGRIA